MFLWTLISENNWPKLGKNKCIIKRNIHIKEELFQNKLNLLEKSYRASTNIFQA